jgi:tRNA pseudouridine38-40 synthase
VSEVANPEAARQVLLWVQFDGTDFCGFQKQLQDRTVAGTLEAAWQKMLGETVVARSSSRTDSGVHARRMPVLIRTQKDVQPRGLMLGLNSFLPTDLSVQEALDVPTDFDVRNDAVGKRYVYRLWVAESRAPLWRRFAWQVRGPLDVAAMQEAAQHLQGVHDFSAFRGAGCVAKSTVRHIRRVHVDASQSPLVQIEVDGNAFLLNMVRIFAGTLVDIGRGRFQPADVPAILASHERTRSGQTAPSHGLTLDDVFYGPAGARQGLDYKNLLANMESAR